ncbi:MAG: PorT family protein [Chitinophagaceae bacterium]|jgi:hypothetical protein|nr:PorT family protein [Chitinophagaceae bacterium]
MKKFISLLLVIVLFMSVSYAQGIGKIYYGVKGGYNYVLSAYTASKTNAVHGGYAGFMMKIPFENRLHFNPQIDINYRGMQADSLPKSQFSKVTEFQVRVMPLVQIDFKHPDENANTFFVQFGPSIGFGLTGDQTKQDAAGVPTSAKLKYGFQAYGKYDANWHAGLGYETNGGLRLLVDYAYGLSNMINTEFGPVLKYHTISAGVGYWFGKKKTK